MKCRCCAILAIPPFMTLLIAKNEAQSAELVTQICNSAKNEARSAELVTQMRNSAEDEARSAELQKERELREDLDFIKYRLDCSKQEITYIHIVLYTPYYNWIIAREEIANVYAIIKSHIDNLTNTYKMRDEIDTKALVYAQRRESRCLAKGLHLDRYNEELDLAFEYSSNQHYQIIPFFHPQGQINLDAQIWRDWEKRALCYREGVILITIPYCVIDLETFIKSALHAFDYLPIPT
ncbi:37624_t:CDS:2 [Gigaspora margarita]|uniref:37624_t:CDS:1 n=1 Tax=Gigaspora margarita TaxID=4874 RepID=A0ABN7V3T5_GIGMA|nr:37624_t:CDS:2 [Gigaspora margarita]